MPQTCPACLWISSDDVAECERCGQPFDSKLKPQNSAGAVGAGLKIIVAVFAFAIIGAVIVQRAGDRFPELWAGVKGALRGFYIWLLGPNEIYKPYLVTALVITLITWAVLWLLARLSR
ncbi:MAG: hypothetical protein FJ030_11815 [Chloroflexi bacterium]|nr:hypothetical protein [Chloroflexota bacterium]